MCGIGFSYLGKSGADGQSTSVVCQKLIEERLKGNISFRGPDLPHSSKNVNMSLTLFASVLHMQGTTMMPQPYEYSLEYDNENEKVEIEAKAKAEKFTFCWNGEAYCIQNFDRKDNGNTNVCHGDDYDDGPWFDILNSTNKEKKDELRKSDTKLVMDYLAAYAFNKKKNNGNLKKNKESDTIHRSIANALSYIQGEYSFILHHSNSQNEGCVYFGRDPLGRRSLLMTDVKKDVSEDSSLSSSPTIHKEFIVSSVGLTYDLQSLKNDISDNNVNDANNENIIDKIPFPSIEMEEIPAGRVYCLNLCNSQLTYEKIPNRSTLQSSSRTNEVDDDSNSANKSNIIKQASERLHQYLDNAIHRRVVDVPIIKQKNFIKPSRNTTGEMKDSTKEENSDETDTDHLEASVAILFSGGVDSVVIAALCHNHIPENQPIDLINVAFANTKANHTNKGKFTSTRTDNLSNYNHALFETSPDRQAALLSFQEMTTRWPNRKWRFIAVNVDYDEVLRHEKTICGLISPLSSTMDFNIGTAFWFASRGHGFQRDVRKNDKDGMLTMMICRQKTNQLRFSDDQIQIKEKIPCSKKNCDKMSQNGCIFGACKFCCGSYQRPINQYLGGRASLCPVHNEKSKSKKKSKKDVKDTQNKTKDQDSKQQISSTSSSHQINMGRKMITSRAKVILIGIGADEQMAGYGRHRSTYKRGGYDALRKELAMEKDRLWTRNLGRDDRSISYHGKEARFPFLDEDVVAFLNSLDVEQLCDMEKPPGQGDKMILRLIAQKIGVTQCSDLVKRAIQFGSRIAKVSDTQRFGSSNKASGSACHR